MVDLECSKTTVYFVRHAEAMGNILEFFQGRTDCEVSLKGYKQLEFLSERFKNISIDIIYSSPLIRSRETASAVNKYHNSEIIIDDRIIEIDGGDWEGKNWADLPKTHPKEYDLWQNHMHDFYIENGESMIQVFDRMRSAVIDIISENIGKTIVIVSHGCALRNYLCYANGDSIDKLAEVGWSDNTAVSLIEYDEMLNPKIVYKNNNDHLSSELSTLAFSDWCKEDENGEFLDDAG